MEVLKSMVASAKRRVLLAGAVFSAAFVGVTGLAGATATYPL